MKSFEAACGARVIVEESHALPLVDVVFLWRMGAADEPADKAGLARMLARLLRKGERGQRPSQVEEAIALLGARLSVTISRTTVRLHGTVLSRNLTPFFRLMASLVRNPALRTKDLQSAKGRIRAEREDLLDDDGALADRQLRRAVFGEEHLLARPIGGTRHTLGRIRRADLVELHQSALRGRRLIIGAAGDVTAVELQDLVEESFGDLPKGRGSAAKIPAPKLHRGRHVFIVDKPGRSQTQLGIGTLGIKRKDPRLAALLVGDTAFGGLFSSRLMQAVREDNGWSYSAYSSLGAGTQRDLWCMWTHPSVANVTDCAALQLELLEEWVESGLRAAEVRFAKRYLIGSRCLDEDTAARRLELALDAVQHGFPITRSSERNRRIRAVTTRAANESVRQLIRPQHLGIVAVGDAASLAPRLERLPQVDDVTIVKPRTLL